MTESGDEVGGVASGGPGGKPLGVDGGKLVDGVTSMVQDALGSIPDRPNEGNKESGKDCHGGITKAQVALGHREEGEVSGQG